MCTEKRRRGHPTPSPVLRPERQPFRNAGREHERRDASVLRPPLLNITASLHAAAPSVAQRTVTFHFLQTVKLVLGGGEGAGAPVCLLSSKGIPSSL